MTVSANFLDILGVQPLLGRGFRPEEEDKSGPPVALLSSALWRSRFDGDPSVLGKVITLSTVPYTVVGVLPPGFAFPRPGVDIWLTKPSRFVDALSPLLGVFGRLNPGVRLTQATAELAILNQHYRTAHPGMLDGKAPDGKTLGGKNAERVVPLKDRLVGNVRLLLWMLFGAVGFVLLTACANVASLLLARAASRSREFAVRAAIGASRMRIVGQLLAESIVLALAGGALGTLLARWILAGIAHMSALELPRAGEIQLDRDVLAFAILLSIATGVLFGLIPSLGVSRPDLAACLRTSGQAASTSRRRMPLGLSSRSALVVAQIALSMILLIGAALLMQSLGRLYGVNPGFNPSNLLTLHISLPQSYDTGQKQAAFFDQLARRVQSVPGVRGAAASLVLPMMSFPKTPVQLASQPLQPLNQRPLAAIQNVTTGFFGAYEVPLKRGRDFSDGDAANAPLTAIINESFARLFWPAYPNGPDPIGQHVLIGARKDSFEIVGIVADMHQALEVDPFPTIFRFFDQYPLSGAAFTVRTTGDPLKFVSAVRDQVRVLDPDQPISSVQTMEDLIAAEGGQRRVVLTLLECFAGAALLLSVIGIYGLIAYSVAQRTQEVGIRRALGARNLDILRLVVGSGLALTLAGIALGMGGALALTRIMTALLFRTSATDPATFALVALLFLLVALGASYIPARRATKLDPSLALK